MPWPREHGLASVRERLPCFLSPLKGKQFAQQGNEEEVVKTGNILSLLFYILFSIKTFPESHKGIGSSGSCLTWLEKGFPKNFWVTMTFKTRAISKRMAGSGMAPVTTSVLPNLLERGSLAGLCSLRILKVTVGFSQKLSPPSWWILIQT